MIPAWLTPRRALVGVAAVSLLGAVVAVLPSWLVPGFVVAAASSSAASSTLVVVAAVVAGLYGLRVLAADGHEAPRSPAVQFPTTPPEVAVHEVRRVVGEDVNGAASSAEEDEQWHRRRHRRRARETLRTAAVDAVAEATGCDRDAADRLVAEGRWTDRARARAYLATDDAVRPPLRTRVRDWAAGERTERAVRDAVAAILAVRDGDDAVARAALRADEATAEASDADTADFRLTGAELASPDGDGTAGTGDGGGSTERGGGDDGTGVEGGESERAAAVAEADGGDPARSGGDRP